jgi:hypothetical protein
VSGVKREVVGEVAVRGVAVVQMRGEVVVGEAVRREVVRGDAVRGEP